MKIFLYTKKVVGMIIPMMLFTMFIQGQTYSDFVTSCTSKDLLLEDAEVSGGDQCNNCNETDDIQRSLKLYINNKTGSVRTNFKFWATLLIIDPVAKTTRSIPIEGCKGPVYPNSINQLDFGPLPTFKCGSKLILKDIIMAWTDASKGPKNDCINLTLSNITPKCGVLPEKIVRSGMIVFVNQIQSNCSNGGKPSDAAIDITVEGGTPGYKYLWTASEGGEIPAGQSTNEDLTGIKKSGKYKVTITDGTNICTVTRTYTVKVLELPSLSAVLNQSNCNSGTPSDGGIDLTVTGGTGVNYNYIWGTADGTIPGGQTNSQDLAGIKKSGNYNVTVSGTADGCYQSTSYAITVLQLPKISSSTITQGTCDVNGKPRDAAINISVESGNPSYSYTWNASNGGVIPDGQSNIEDLTGIKKTGNYAVTITDAKNCKITNSYSITVSELPTLSAALVQSNCNNGSPSDGSIDLSVTGGTGISYSYSWVSANGTVPNGQTNSQDLSGIKKSGNYNVTVTDNTGCYQSTSYSITILPAPGLSTSTVTQGACGAGGNPSDASINITISGGTQPYTYTWTASNGGEIPDGKRNVEDLTGIKKSGNYTFTASDLNGCLYSNSVAITVPIPPTISCLSVVNSSCESGTPTLGAINIIVSGGKADYRYAWTASNGGSVPANQSTAQNLSGISTSGSYSVVVTDANSCTAGSVYAVTVLIPPAVPQFTIIEQPDICGAAKGSLAISNNGSNLEYSFNGAAWTSNATVGGIDAGSGPNYTISVRNIYGCISKVVGLCAGPSTTPTTAKSTNLTTTVANVAQPTSEVAQQSTNTNVSNLGSATLEATLSVKAMPNPFNDQVRFTINSAEHGTATLDIYTVYGQKLKTVYKGMVNPGINYFDLKLASAQRTAELIYVFTMGTQKITGKLIQNAQ